MAKNKKGKKRKRIGKCVHCLGWFKNLTDDHVFPKSWYSSSTPPDTPKWKIPSCGPCNEKHGRNEEYLLVRLGISFDSDNPEFGEIGKKAFRARTPESEKNSKDAKKRSQLGETLRNELKPFNEEYFKHYLPGFGPDKAEIEGSSLLIKQEAIDMLAIKIVKGLAYIYDKTLIEKTHDFTISLLDGPDPNIEQLIDLYGGSKDIGPSIQSKWAFVDEDKASRVHIITIWEKMFINVFVLPRPK